MERFVIIGAGAAGISAAQVLREFRPNDIVTVISIDEHVHSRCMLHKFLGHERTIQGINFVGEDFFEKKNIYHIPCQTVSKIDTEAKLVHYGGEYSIPYDKLLIAAGAGFFIPPIPHFREAPNVFGFRDLSDALKIDEAFGKGKRVFIVGSGLVGLDAASALCHRGAEITIAEMAPRVMPLQTDDYAASVYQKVFEEHGCRFLLGIGAADAVVDSEGNITEVILSTGEHVPCDFIIMARESGPEFRSLRPAVSRRNGLSRWMIICGPLPRTYMRLATAQVSPACGRTPWLRARRRRRTWPASTRCMRSPTPSRTPAISSV